MFNVCAIIVTFNREKLLSECLASLSSQSLALKKIVVVNNASTDGTLSLLNQLTKSNPLIEPLNLTVNTGGAGGFYAGLRFAFEQTDYEWFWLMDDDVEPFPNALEGLLAHARESKCIHGVRLNPDGSPYFWESQFKPSVGFSIPNADLAFKSDSKVTRVNVGCFEGMLIHRDIVQKIGYPDPRFFIAWDDTVYGYLASKHTPVLYVNHPTLIRKRDLKKVNLGFRTLNENSDLYRYYHIKNRFLVRQYLKNLGEFSPIPFHVMTGILFLKEILRALFLQKNIFAFKPLINGLRDGIKEYPLV